MANLAQSSTDAGARRLLTRWNRQFQNIQSPAVRYGLAIVSVAAALGLSLALQYYRFRDVEVPVLALAIAVTTWYAGNGPAVVAIVLSSLCFDYFFTEPYHSLEINSRDLPYFFIFVIWGLIVAGFSAVRRQVEESLRQAQEELAKRAVELQAANTELEAFAYSVSHDLRAPLRHVVGYAELLQKHAASVLDEKANRYLKTILEAAKRMGNLIDDLLGFSRIGRAETKKAAVNLEQLVAQVIAEFAQETSGRDIAWKIGALPVCYGDRPMLKVVFVNLLSRVNLTALALGQRECGTGRHGASISRRIIESHGGRLWPVPSGLVVKNASKIRRHFPVHVADGAVSQSAPSASLTVR